MGILFAVMVVAAVLAVVFFAQARSAGAAVLTLKAEIEKVRKDGEADRTALREAQAEIKTKGQQLVEAREKLTEARKKAEPKAQKGATKGAREAELEEDLIHARALLEGAHAAEGAARKDAAAAKAAAAAAQAELAKAQDRIRELAARPAPAAAPAANPDAALAEAARRAEERRKEAEVRAADLDGQLKALREREVKLREEMKKAKGRAETNNKVFLVTKSDLDLTRERLALAERRLWQAGLTLPPVAQAKERPKATGPAAADRPREEKPADAAAPAAEAAAPGAEAPAPAAAAPVAEAAPAPAASAAEGEATAETPLGVAPLRRRPAGDGTAEAKPE